MKPEDDRKQQDDILKRSKPIEFHKHKPDAAKAKDRKIGATPSPHAPIVPCIKCGKTHRKGAICKPG